MALALVGVIALGCGDKDKATPATLSQVLPLLPLPPASRAIAQGGGDEAMQITFASDWTADRVADYYRATLTRAPWTLVNDTKTADGTIALYAEREGPPLWVTVRSDSSGSGSIVTLAGARAKGDTLQAAPDSARGGPASPARDTIVAH